MSTHIAPELPSTGFTREKVTFRFNDIDMFGHLNNAVYLELLDLGKVQYFIKANDGEFSAPNIAFVIVHIDIDFYNSTHAKEQIDVVTRLDRIGEHSAEFEQWVVNRQSNEIKCHAHTILAHIDTTTGKCTPVTPEYKTRILKAAENLTAATH